LKDAIKQWGNIAGLVAGFMKHDYQLIGRSLEDVIIEPVRSILIPVSMQLKIVAKKLEHWEVELVVVNYLFSC
jgi:homoserine kinase